MRRQWGFTSTREQDTSFFLFQLRDIVRLFPSLRIAFTMEYSSQYNMGDTVGAPVNEETVGHLRQRLNVMRDIVKDEEKDGKKKVKRRQGKCNRHDHRRQSD